MHEIIPVALCVRYNPQLRDRQEIFYEKINFHERYVYKKLLSIKNEFHAFQAYQTDNPDGRFTFADLHVEIRDRDDNPPSMSPLSYTRGLPENPEFGLLLVKVSATDPDEVRKTDIYSLLIWWRNSLLNRKGKLGRTL